MFRIFNRTSLLINRDGYFQRILLIPRKFLYQFSQSVHISIECSNILQYSYTNHSWIPENLLINFFKNFYKLFKVQSDVTVLWKQIPTLEEILSKKIVLIRDKSIGIVNTVISEICSSYYETYLEKSSLLID